MAKRLEYDIVTDASKGIAGLKQFSSAAKKAMGEVGDSLDDTTTSAQKVAKALSGLAGDLERELKGAATAADALATALGPEISSRADLGSVVADLHKMGLTFDEITADADTLAGSLRQLDTVQINAQGLDNVAGSAKRAAGGVDEVAKSADSSKSVLANMVGNATQDLGALGGVAGSAGVAIGQMGEYMADAASSGDKFGTILTNFGKVAAPIGAIALVTQLVTSEFEKVSKAAEEQKARVEELFGAYREGKTLLEAFQTQIAKTGTFDTQMGDILPQLNEMNISLEQFTELVKLPPDELQAWADKQRKTVTEGSKGYHALFTILGAVAGARDADSQASERQRITNEALHFGQIELNKAYADALDPQKALNRVQEEGLATSERVNKILADQAQAQRDVAAAIDDTTAQWSAMSDAVSEKSFTEAIDQFNSLSELDLAQMRQNTVKSFDDVKDAIKKAAGEVKNWGQMDLTPDSFEELRGMPDAFAAVTDAVTSMRGTIQTELKASFDTGGIKDFSSKFDFFAGQVRQQFTDMFRGMGLPEDQVQKQVQSILDDLSLLPKSKEIIIKLTRDKEAQNALDLFMGDIQKIEEAAPVVDIRTKLAAGDIQGALDELNAIRLIEGKDPIVLPTDVDKVGAETATATALARAQSYLDHHPALITPTPDAVALQHTSDAIDDAANPGGRPRTAHIDVTVNGITSIGGGKYRLPNGIIISDAGGIIPPDNVGLVAERRPEIVNSRYLVTSPTLVPPGTRVTSGRQTARILRTRGTRGLKPYDRGGMVTGSNTINLNINAGVVGNRYDVMKAVQRANLDKLRLFGERG